ncbi:hypothetical protein C8R45DRAFT_96817 [Mycena sanguinolenta]|nr:hypothetical protein C8R45DRAFT_96817 [Mycena sanguinolenta]
MGVDKGFDLYPPLKNTAQDNEMWAAFLKYVTSHYEGKGDPNFTTNAAGDIVFTQGEHPTLKRKGYQFRRFSSKLTSAGNVGEYLDDVKRMARAWFGDRVHYWIDGAWPDIDPPYGWDEVYAAAEEQ